MDSQGVVLLFRKDMADETTPTLWSDDEIYGYLDEAQKTLVRALGGIQDATSSLSRAPYGVGATTIKLSPLILKIKQAYRESDGRPIKVINVNDMERNGLRFDNSTGAVDYIVTGMDENVAFLRRIPTVADVIRMVIERLPREVISAEFSPQELEVPEQHHRNLMLGMKELAYDKQDAETFDKRKANEFREKFQAYCAQAKAEKARRMHKPRTVQYGGLPMGTVADTDYSRSR